MKALLPILRTLLPALITLSCFAESEEATESSRLKENRILHPKNKTRDIYQQVAPPEVSHMRLASSDIATQKHFTGDFNLPADQTILTQQFPEIDNQLSQMDPFFRDSSLILDIRSAFFRTSNIAPPPMGGPPPRRLESAWAIGGSLNYKSGWYKDFFSMGLGYYTSSGLYKPYGQQGTRLLKANRDGGQGSINVLGQAYAEFKYDIYRLKAYRQSLDTPFINPHFDRMVPQLFEAYVIGTKTIQPDEKGMGLRYNKEYPVSFLTGYVREELDRGRTNFVPMSSLATRDQTDKERGVAFGGLQITPVEPLAIDLWEYYGVDMFNTFYAEGELDYDLDSTGDWQTKLAVQFADQRSVGEEIAGEWSTQMVGLFAGTSYQGFTFSFRFNHVFDGTGTNPGGGPAQFGFESPWGRYPGFTKSTLLDYRDPDSTMYGIFGSYNFGELTSTLKGLELASSYVFQDRDNTGSGAGPDQNEFDLILKYKPDFLKGLSFDIRGSWVSAYDTPTGLPSAPAVNDYRFIVNYTIPLL